MTVNTRTDSDHMAGDVPGVGLAATGLQWLDITRPLDEVERRKLGIVCHGVALNVSSSTMRKESERQLTAKQQTEDNFSFKVEEQ